MMNQPYLRLKTMVKSLGKVVAMGVVALQGVVVAMRTLVMRFGACCVGLQNDHHWYQED